MTRFNSTCCSVRKQVCFQIHSLLNVKLYLTPACLWGCFASRHGAYCGFVFQSTSCNWSAWILAVPSMGCDYPMNGETEAQSRDLTSGAWSTASSSASSALWTFWITPFSPYQLAFFQVILFLRCFNIFLPPTSHLLIYQTDKKLCV